MSSQRPSPLTSCGGSGTRCRRRLVKPQAARTLSTETPCEGLLRQPASRPGQLLLSTASSAMRRRPQAPSQLALHYILDCSSCILSDHAFAARFCAFHSRPGGLFPEHKPLRLPAREVRPAKFSHGARLYRSLITACPSRALRHCPGE
jgi:hypothetical protein